MRNGGERSSWASADQAPWNAACEAHDGREAADPIIAVGSGRIGLCGHEPDQAIARALVVMLAQIGRRQGRDGGEMRHALSRGGFCGEVVGCGEPHHLGDGALASAVRLGCIERKVRQAGAERSADREDWFGDGDDRAATP
jgi:hypothetical protein